MCVGCVWCVRVHADVMRACVFVCLCVFACECGRLSSLSVSLSVCVCVCVCACVCVCTTAALAGSIYVGNAFIFIVKANTILLRDRANLPRVSANTQGGLFSVCSAI